MAKRYSARAIDAACQLLSAAASNRYTPCGSDHDACIGCVADIVVDDSELFGVDGPFLLAMDTYNTIADAVGGYAERCAEAEALLRCGWRPS